MCTPGCMFWPPPYTLSTPLTPPHHHHLPLLSSPPPPDSAPLLWLFICIPGGANRRPWGGWDEGHWRPPRGLAFATHPRLRRDTCRATPLPHSSIQLCCPNLTFTPILIHKFSLNLTLTFKDKAGGPEILAPKSHPGPTKRNTQRSAGKEDYYFFFFFFLRGRVK